MTTQHTLRDARIAELESQLKSRRITAHQANAELFKLAYDEGYLRAKAEDAPLLAAAEAAERQLDGHRCKYHGGMVCDTCVVTRQLRAAIKLAKEGTA